MRKSLTSRLLSAIGLAGIEGIISQREPAVKVRKYAKGHDHEAAKKAAGIKRLRRQQRNTLLAEKGAFADSRSTYPLVHYVAAQRLRPSMEAAIKGTGAAMRLSALG